MTATTSASPAPKRKSWLRRLGWCAGGLVLLLVVTYFVVTSGAFFKGVILPKVGKAMNADVRVDEASLSPFSRVTLRGLTVRTVGPEPLLTAGEIRLRYNLKSILGGTIKVDEVSVVNPRIHLEQNADGTSNLDPLLQGQKPAESKQTGGPGSSQPPQLEIARIAVENGAVDISKKERDGTATSVKLDKLNLALTDLRNGQTAKLTFTGASEWYSTGPSNSSAGADIKLELNVGLTPSLGLSWSKGEMSFAVSKATGAAAELAGFRTTLDCDITPIETKLLALRAYRGPQLLSEIRISGPFDLAKKEGALDLVVTNVNLADWKGFAPDADPAGRVAAQGRLTAQQEGRQIGFEFRTQLTGLGARVGTNKVSELGLTLSTSGQVTNFNSVRLAPSEISLTHQGSPGATATASGFISLNPRSAVLDLTTDLELARLLKIHPQPDLVLSDGRVHVKTRVEQQDRTQTLTGTAILTNVNGRVTGIDLKDLAGGSAFDVSATDGTIIDLRQVLLTLAETTHTKSNRVQLTGRVDLSKTNALEGALKLFADTLDVTPYYNLFDQPKATTSSPAPTRSQPSPGSPPPPSSEPAPLQLPVRQLLVDARIGKMWLREVDATNVEASLKVEQSKVTIQPLKLAMNGAPLDSAMVIDLSVPGWKYRIDFNAAGLPIAPLVDSFVPDYRGRAKGELWANSKIEGAGFTGPNLRKNLAGNLAFSFTNAQIQIAGPRLRSFLSPIATALNAPALLDTPLNWVSFGASMGSGKFGLSQLALVSPMFSAVTKGDALVADDPRSSKLTRWPMSFQLERSLAERLRLAPKDAPTNAPLVSMPDFVKVAGTLDTPKPEIDLKALAGAALIKYVDKIPGVDEKTGNLLKGVLGGSKTGTNAANTNAPATNNPAGLLDIFKRPKPAK